MTDTFETGIILFQLLKIEMNMMYDLCVHIVEFYISYNDTNYSFAVTYSDLESVFR